MACLRGVAARVQRAGMVWILVCTAWSFMPLATGAEEPTVGSSIDGPTGHQPAELVGSRGRRDQVVVQGLNVLDPIAVRNELFSDGSVLKAAHPRAAWPEYLKTLQRRLLAGMQYSGYPDATVEFNDQAASGIHLVVEEGRRYLAGPIEIVGAQQLPVDRIIMMLTSKTAETTEYESSTGTFTAVAFQSGIKVGKVATSTGTVAWKLDAPAKCGTAGQANLEKNLKEVLRDLGYFDVKARIEFVNDREAGWICPKIHIESEGLQSTIDEIKIEGLTSYDESQIRGYLGINEGMRFESSLVAELDQMLRHSGRFQRAKVVVEPRKITASQPAAGKFDLSRFDLPDGVTITINQSPQATDMQHLRLQLKVEELKGVSQLGAPFSTLESALLKYVEWLENLATSGEDLVFTGENPYAEQMPMIPRIEAVFSPTHGMLLKLLDKEGRWLHALLLSNTECGVLARQSQHKLTRLGKGNLVLRLNFAPTPEQDADGKNFKLAIGGSFTVSDPDVSEAATDFATSFMVNVDPEVELALLSNPDTKVTLQNGMVSRTSKEMVRISDVATGRLMTMESRPTKEKFWIRAEPGAFQAAQAKLRAETAHFVNQYEAQLPVSSVFRFIAEESVHYLPKHSDSSVPVNPLAQGSILGVVCEQVMRPLDRLHDQWSDSSEEEEFTIPYDKEAGQQNWLFFVLDAGLPINDRLFAEGTWPHAMVRDALHSVSGNGEYLPTTIRESMHSDTMGPLGNLVVARVAVYLQPGYVKVLANHGLRNLNSAGMQIDLRLLLAENSLAGECLRRAAAVLRDVEPAELARLQVWLGPEWQTQIDQWAASLRSRADLPLDQAILEAADELWPTHIEPWLRAELLTARRLGTKESKETNDNEAKKNATGKSLEESKGLFDKYIADPDEADDASKKNSGKDASAQSPGLLDDL